MKELGSPKRLGLLAAPGSQLERGLTMARDRGPTEAELRALTATLFGGAAAGIGTTAEAGGIGTTAGAGGIGTTAEAGGIGTTAKAGAPGWRMVALTKGAAALVVAGAMVGATTAAWRALRPDHSLSMSATSARTADRAPGPAITSLVSPATTPALTDGPMLRPSRPEAPPPAVRSDRSRARAAISPHPHSTATSDEQAPSTPAVAAVPASGDEELRLLGAAQRALPGDPTHALALVREHARRFPDGLLSEEREAVAVSALWAVGQRDEARRRAERFTDEHPNSTYAGRMRQLLAHSLSTHVDN
jgi:hypothetical protein